MISCTIKHTLLQYSNFLTNCLTVSVDDKTKSNFMHLYFSTLTNIVSYSLCLLYPLYLLGTEIYIKRLIVIFFDNITIDFMKTVNNLSSKCRTYKKCSCRKCRLWYGNTKKYYNVNECICTYTYMYNQNLMKKDVNMKTNSNSMCKIGYWDITKCILGVYQCVYMM